MAPVLILLLCGMLDFGLMFGGYLGMENGVSSGARDASVGQYQYTGSGTCGGTDATSQLVCRVASEMGPLMGTVSGSLKIGVCFPAQSGATPCSGSGTRGSDVEVCASVQLHSTTGFTGFVAPSKPTVSSSRLVLEQIPAFSTFTSGSSVSYQGQTINGMTCS